MEWVHSSFVEELSLSNKLNSETVSDEKYKRVMFKAIKIMFMIIMDCFPNVIRFAADTRHRTKNYNEHLMFG